MPADNPTTATPSEIDAELARLHAERAKAEATVETLTKRHTRWLRESAADLATALEPRIEQARQRASDCEAAMQPLDEEFDHRGGWTRAWLVLNTGGHVHRSMLCRTCFESTKFAWLTQLSGHDEAEVVDLAGKAACTECYPSAPVEVRNRPSRIKTPEQLARDEQKAERAKAKAAKAITAPGGLPLRTTHSGVITTEFSARREYCELLSYARYLAKRNVAHNREAIAEHHEDASLILTALAAKHDRTEDDLREELAPKVEARWKREHSNWG
ncbi:hypothetical protein ACIRG5_38740 [Lentzea sp. NPDC102401]|uniref:hypothetical protein n=1 Tax=Lentzea sp. NPDC102401 TaxID=3364128 RepID=UPI00382D2E9B